MFRKCSFVENLSYILKLFFHDYLHKYLTVSGWVLYLLIQIMLSIIEDLEERRNNQWRFLKRLFPLFSNKYWSLMNKLLYIKSNHTLTYNRLTSISCDNSINCSLWKSPVFITFNFVWPKFKTQIIIYVLTVFTKSQYCR